MQKDRQPAVQASRRTLLGALVTLGSIPGITAVPRQWTRPVVDAVLLPAHAQTSESEEAISEGSATGSEETNACTAEAGCYEITNIPDRSFQWPGGSGPFAVDVYSSTDCTGSVIVPSSLASAVVAISEEEAIVQLSCPDTGIVAQVSTNPSPGEGCSFFICQAVVNSGP